MPRGGGQGEEGTARRLLMQAGSSRCIANARPPAGINGPASATCVWPAIVENTPTDEYPANARARREPITESTTIAAAHRFHSGRQPAMGGATWLFQGAWAVSYTHLTL